MVITVQQARQQLTQQQQALTQARTQIEKTTLPPLTPAELRARGRTEILQREAKERQLESVRQRELAKLKPAEQELGRAEKEIVRVEEAIREQGRQRAAFNKALDVFFSKRPEAIFFLSKLERKFFRQISAGRQSAVKKSIDEAIRKLEEQGVKEIKPVFEPGKILPVAFEGIKFETVPGRIQPVRVPIPKPLQIGLPPPPVPIELRPKPPSKIIEVIKKISARFPREERGLAGLFATQKTIDKLRVESPEITTDVFPFIPTGGGTAEFRQRQKTFFEQLSVSPKDKSAIQLKKEVELTQGKFERGNISEVEAQNLNDASLDKFTKVQIRKGIPRDFAFGAGFALLQAVPVVGTVASVALGADLLLRREQIAKQFIDFPVETAAGFGAFVVGGLIVALLVEL